MIEKLEESNTLSEVMENCEGSEQNDSYENDLKCEEIQAIPDGDSDNSDKSNDLHYELDTKIGKKQFSEELKNKNSKNEINTLESKL